MYVATKRKLSRRERVGERPSLAQASQPTRVEASPVQCGIPALAADEEFRGPHLIVMQHGWCVKTLNSGEIKLNHAR